MAELNNEAIVRRFYDELWNSWNLAAADELLASGVRFRGSLGLISIGREAFKAYVETVRSTFPDWYNQIDELLTIGDRVVVRLTWTGTHQGPIGGVAPTGKRVRYVGAAFFRINGDKMAEAWIVGDTQELWRQLGVLET